jgi:dienelactone hydrolase
VLDEFVGAFHDGRESSVGVVILGGSEGGWPTVGAALAARLADAGFSSLALAYFGLLGLPEHLSSIPLEYVAEAVGWLQARCGLGPESTAVLGSSRGSEAALLLAIHHPELVHHVVAIVPSNLAMGAWPPPTRGPAWTLAATPVPYATRFGPGGDDDAVLQVEKIVGRVMVVGAGRDLVWPSAEMASAIADRRARHGHVDDIHVEYPLAGHRITPRAAGPVESNEADRQAAEDLWHRLEDFLDDLRHRSR